MVEQVSAERAFGVSCPDQWENVGVSETQDDAVDPQEFLRALLKISPEDAEEVRERTPGTRPEKPRQDGPTADYGDKK